MLVASFGVDIWPATRGTALRKLAETAAVLATVVVVCFAVLQVSGRFLFWQLPRLEGTINTLLASSGIAFDGLEGRWQGINPGFFAAGVRFPAGQAFGVDFELDVLESLARNRVIARHLTVTDGHMAFVKTPDGWRSRGGRGVRADNLFGLLAHSDQVWVRGRLVAEGNGREGALHIEAMLVNRDGEHRFHVTAQDEPQCDDCALTVDGDIDERGVGAVRLAASRFALGDELLAVLGASGAGGPMDFAVRGDWRRDANGAAAARADIQVAIAPPPGGAAAVLAASLSAWSESRGYRGRFDELAATSADARLDLANTGLRLLPARGGGYFADLWLPPVDVSAAATTLATFLGDAGRTGHWLRRLAPHGQLRDFRLRADAEGIAYAGHGTGGMAGYKGVPQVAGGPSGPSVALGGHQGALRLHMAGRDVRLAFPDFFPNKAPFSHAAGTMTFVFPAGYRGLRGTGFRARQRGANIFGGFAWARPMDPAAARVTVDWAFDHADLPLARDYLPLTLAPALREWLVGSVRAGKLRDGRLLYHGHVKAGGRRALRRTELAAQVEAASVAYHPDWPAVSGFDGRLELTHESTRLTGRGRVFETALDSIAVVAPRRGDHARLRVAGAAPAARLLRFARATPVQDAMTFLSDAWRAAGDIAFEADLAVPLGGQAPAPGDFKVDLTLREAVADLADFGLRFEALTGALSFASPFTLSTPEPLRGQLFGAPVVVAFASDADRVRIGVDGAAAAADVLALLGRQAFAAIDGRAAFGATLTLFPATGRAPELAIDTDLAGMAVALPAPLGKPAETTAATRVDLQFQDERIAASFNTGETLGWLHVADGDVLAGAIGVDGPMPMVDAAGGRVVVGGRIGALDGSALAALMAAPRAERRGFAWALRDFQVGELRLQSVRLRDLRLNGHADAGEVRFEVRGPALTGTVSKTGEQPWQLRLRELRLPAPAEREVMLDVAVIDQVVDADVVIDRIRIGPTDYGRWSFKTRPNDEGLALLDVQATGVRGLDISATAPAFWAKAGETRFEGGVSATDVRGALTAWGFAPSMEAERFTANGQLRWPGSPFDFALAHISGQAALSLDKGRFLTVPPGGARIMSLINFSEIVRRMRLDFSDVFGRGTDFDTVQAELVLDNGLGHFAKPAEISGSAASFRIGGTVDLDTGALDNEMIVTVSVLHRNLPWYAAFLAFSNPASAAGVLLGSQVLFKNQIRQFSSGKYVIGGTYEDPEVKFVGIWRDDLAAPSLPEEPPDLAKRGQDEAANRPPAGPPFE